MDNEIKAIVERINLDATHCHSEIKKLFRDQCINLDSQKRINISIQTLICESSIDKRFSNLPRFVSNEQFIHDLNPALFRTFSSYFMHADLLCKHSSSEELVKNNNKKINNLFITLTYSIEHLEFLKKKVLIETEYIKKELDSIQKKINYEAEKINNVIDIAKNRLVDMSYLVDTINKVSIQFQNIKKYAYIVAGTFCISILIPEILPPILSLTLLQCSLELQYPNKFGKKFTLTFYYTLCVFISGILILSKVHYLKNKTLSTFLTTKMFHIPRF